MRRRAAARARLAHTAALALAAGLALAPSLGGAAAPDTLFLNGRIYTQDERLPWAEAIAVSGGRVAAIGANADIERLRAPGTRAVDLNRHFVMPGFIDAHVHFLAGGEYLTGVALRDARTLAEVQRRVADYAAQHPGSGWILGEAWSYGYPDLPRGEFHHDMIDRVAGDRPVFLSSGMAHAAWVNGRALALAGITRRTPDPRNGTIVRDAAGEPTGWLKEDAAIDLVRAKIPPPSPADTLAALHAAIAEAGRYGITRVDSAGDDFDSLAQLEEIQQRGELSVRIQVAEVIAPPALSERQFRQLERAAQRYRGDFLAAGTAKFFLDGVLESHTAYLPGGYADAPHQTGMLFWKRPAYIAAVRRLTAAGFQIYTHAIGNGAIKLALDAYAAARGDAPAGAPARNRIEHAEAPDRADIARFGALQVIASMQPAMIYPRDQWQGMEGLWQTYAGNAFLPNAFAVRSILDAHGIVAFGTDWPIVELNPLFGIRNAVLRQSLDGRPPGGYVPAQRISVAQALRAYTLDAAYASRREADEGTLAVGKLADFVALSGNPLQTPPADLAQIRVELTAVAGRIVYRGPGNPL